MNGQAFQTGIRVIMPTRQWDSRTIASEIYGTSAVNLRKFGAYRPSYKDPRSGSVKIVSEDADQEADDDSMMVDDDYYMPEILRPSHALDLLHVQVVEHFSRLLTELAGKAGAAELRQGSGSNVSGSMHAPAWKRGIRPYTEWDARECLEFLSDKRRVAETSPRLEAFLSLPYRRSGARRGQDWSRRDWEVAVGSLGTVGRVWDEAAVEESVEVLQPHVAAIFALQLRPTGI